MANRVLNFAGRLINPLNLETDDFRGVGMQAAVTLSRVQRFWGQCRESYTVGQHTLSMVKLLKSEGADGDTLRWALAHEIYEALTGMDVPTPLKKSEAYAPYLEAEKRALETFAGLYGLVVHGEYVFSDEVVEADSSLLVMEAEALMPYNPEVNWRQIAEPRGKLYRIGATETEIRQDFIDCWFELFGRL
jgi:hypothetical protein